MLRLRLWFVLVLSSLFLQASARDRVVVSGRVTDFRSGKPLAFAAVVVKDGTRGAMSNLDGRYELSLDGSEGVLVFSLLGYEPKEVAIPSRDSVLNVSLQVADLRIKDVVITARRTGGATSSSRVGKAAIEHLQASSLSDVMQLLPGALAKDGTLKSPQQIALRQIVTDKNTSLGTAILVDGAPMANDANMQVNNTAQVGGTQYSSVATGGVDLRSISTDRIEEVEVVKGVPSAQYGDLTSGVVLIKTKSGATPLTARLKSEPSTKLVSVSKGFALPGLMGVVNADFDYSQSFDDVRVPYKGFSRYTSQLGWSGSFGRAVRHSMDIRLGYTYVADVNRSDKDLLQKDEEFTSKENSYRFSVSGKLQPRLSGSWMLEYRGAVSYSHQRSIQRRIVSLNGPQPLANSYVDGEYEGVFLPSEYYSSLVVDGKPINLSASASAASSYSFWGARHRISVGFDLRSDANLGRGQLFDINRPPFPAELGTSRPRSYASLPWMKKGALFLEDALTAKLGTTFLQVQAGARLSSYHVAGATSGEGKARLEPRVNLRHVVVNDRGSSFVRQLAWRFGVGMSYKTPTLLHLFPDKSYEDVVMLSYYAQDPAKRLLWVKTEVKDVTNASLRPAKASKLELGVDWVSSFFDVSFTAFYEQQLDGFDFQSGFGSLTYKRYDPSSVASGSLSGKPSISNFSWSIDTVFTRYVTAVNGSTTYRKGIEYSVSFRKIESLNTSLVVDGAYFNQRVVERYPTYKYPNVTIGGKPYLFLGVFDQGEGRVYEQLNTNLRIITHIPAYRLIVSCLVQNVWFSSVRYTYQSGNPTYYVDKAGTYHLFTSSMAKDPYMSYLTNTYSAYYFKKSVVPFMSEVNLRLTKEFWKQAQVSFLVNRIAEYRPSYTQSSGYVVKVRTMPFFGMELKVLFK